MNQSREEILDKAFEDMHASRLAIAKINQPEYEPNIGLLCKILSSNQLNHPYLLPRQVYTEILDLQNQSIGEKIILRSKYFYRLCSMSRILSEEHGVSKALCPSHRSLFLKEEYIKTGWISLDHFFNDNPFVKILPSDKKTYTFWTSERLDNIDDIVKLVTGLGLPIEWSAYQDPILLRSEISMLPHEYVQIPSVVIGFSSPIFFPSTFHNPNPIALNLSNPPSLSNGFTEVLIRDVPISSISIKPIKNNIIQELRPLKKKLRIYCYCELHDNLLYFYKSKIS